METLVLEQNVKFIPIGGTRKKKRAAILRDSLAEDLANVSLVLLSEARTSEALRVAFPQDSWWLYVQRPSTHGGGLVWSELGKRHSVTGLALAVRRSGSPCLAQLEGAASGAVYAAPPVYVPEIIGALFIGLKKGFAFVDVGEVRLYWTHTQASYKGHSPDKNGPIAGAKTRALQLRELADAVVHDRRAALVTGDLNLLDGHDTQRSNVLEAGKIDADALRAFTSRAEVRFDYKGWVQEDPTNPPVLAGRPHGTYLSGEDRSTDYSGVWEFGAGYDRVGTNNAFDLVYPGLRVERVEIRPDDGVVCACKPGSLRASDHLGLVITLSAGE